MKISDKTLRVTIELIKLKTPYRKIVQMVPEIKSTSMVTRIKKFYIDGEKPKKTVMSERTKRKIQKTAKQNRIIKKSEILVDGMLNILKGFEYMILNLENIQERHEREYPELVKELRKLNSKLKQVITEEIIEEESIKKLLEKITKTTEKAGDIFYHSDIRIRAISSLRKQFESFYRIKADAEVLKNIGKIIDAFIEGCEVLEDEDYFRYKEKVISKNDSTVGWFQKYEGIGETENEQK